MNTFVSDFATLDFNFDSEDPVPCILCEEQFSVVEDEQPLLQHLLDAHKFVIGSVEQIADLRQYILYWKKLQNLELKDFCIIFNTNSEPGAKFPSDTYYLLCNKLPEDNELRSALNKMKLKHVVNQKEFERQDASFSRQCIYCSETVSGGVANCFDHLTFRHGFSVGNPDNIVFGAKLLDVLEQKLRKLQCLFCEKTFRTHVVLRYHMRKKQHRCLNPKNKLYDKFYLLNYLKPGTPWEQAKHDRTIESDVESVSGDEKVRNDTDLLWTDWQEEDIPPATCLFCNFTTSKVPSGLFSHMTAYHTFDFDSITTGLTFYQRVQIINFIRCFVANLKCFYCHSVFQSQDHLLRHLDKYDHCKLPFVKEWDIPLYLFPALNNDGLLYHLEDTEVSGTGVSEAGKIIVPEDVSFFRDSILEDSKLREEITGATEDGSVAMCLFCHYAAIGEYPHTQIYNHMRILHCFDFMEVLSHLPFYSQVKLINYIRWNTAKSMCYFCGDVFDSMISMEEHRALAGHNVLPEAHKFEDARWLQPVLEGDLLLQKLREAGDSDDDENTDKPSFCNVENVFSEDVCVPPSILSDENLRQELLENMMDNLNLLRIEQDACNS